MERRKMTSMPRAATLYAKRPVTIKAIQVLEPFQVETKEGVMQGKTGDFLIEGIEGELYPCDERIFKKIYVPISLKIEIDSQERK